MPHSSSKRCTSHFHLISSNVLTRTNKKRIVISIESVSLNEEFTMTNDSRTSHGQEHLSDAFLWLVGAPLTVLDALYLTRLAPPIDPEHPDTLILWGLGVAACLLLSWSLLSSACAHLVLLHTTPPIVRRIARAVVARYGTRLSRTLLARAGAGALIGSALVTGTPVAATHASAQDLAVPGVSLTWADSPRATQEPPQTDPAGLTTSAPAPAQDAPPPPTPHMPDSITVAPGDSLWSIAASLHPDADDASIDAAWRAIREANADTLPDPNLIHPGQILTLPQDLP